ncbi:THAP domain-containing protein 1-like [Chelmon rostratus]|uniref:THAP domain-containing protein 1-like n=1 Tax=Chelmon rostratus TaxID=109905 RepID=UPI001BEA1C66|nr:THAP domain-containing protein 1-like [Chelmon rostratus]
MVRTCAYPGCTNKDESGSPQTFHRFPLANVALRRLWLLSLGLNVEHTQLPKMRKLRVCSDHFSEDDYLPEGQTKKRILKSTAVPAPQDSTPAAMAEPAQFAEDVEVPEEEGAFAGLPQSTPVKSRFRHDQLMMVLTSPPETGPRTKPSTSGTYIAKPYIAIAIAITKIWWRRSSNDGLTPM